MAGQTQHYEIGDPVVGRIKDETVLSKTGKSWEEWYAILDEFGEAEKGYTVSARYLREEFEIGAWWSNSITSRYEWVRGLRKKKA